MASLKWLKRIKRWQVRWHITCQDGGIAKGSSCFRNKRDALGFQEEKEREADCLRAGLTAGTGGRRPGPGTAGRPVGKDEAALYVA